MRCPNCGTENPAGAQFCQRCGTGLAEGADETTILPPTAPTGRGPEPGTTPFAAGVGGGTAEDIGPALSLEGVSRRPPSRVAEALTGGWPRALAGAALAFLVMLLVGQALSALAAVAQDDPPEVPEVLKIGGLVTYSFHRVGIQATLPDIQIPTPTDPVLGAEGLPQTGAFSLSVTVSVALLLGTLLLVWLLYRAGKSLGVLSGGPAWVRGLAGAKVAIPYALITGLGAVLLNLVPLSFDVPAIPGFTAGGAFELGPALVPAFLWPLAIGLLAGFAGGVAGAPASSWEAPRADGLLAGAVRGGALAAGLAVLLAFVGTQIVAMVHADTAVPFNPSFFEDAFSGPVLQGVASTVFLLFLAPNFGALALAPAMGSSLVLKATGTSFGLQPTFELTLLSLLNYPSGINEEVLSGIDQGAGGIPGFPTGSLIDQQIAPAYYWAFLLVPLIAMVLGGRAAARRASADTPAEGALAGALAGVVFAGATVALVVASGIRLHADAGFGAGTQTVILGAHSAKTLLAAVLWGLVVGALGGVLGASRRPAPAHAAGGPAVYGFGGAPGEPPPPPRPDPSGEEPGPGGVSERP